RAPGTELVDRQVAGDAVEPGVGAPPVVVLAAVLPDLEEGDLDYVPHLLHVSQNALDELEKRPGLAGHQLVERPLVPVPDGHQEVVIRDLDRPDGELRGASAGVD